MSYRHILFDLTDGIAKLTLNRPDRLNSFNVDMHLEVREALQTVEAGARVLVLTGAGRGFCAGQDLSDRAGAASAAPVDLGHSIENYYKPLAMTLRTLPMPVIAAVNGIAAGAGANLALACDLVIAAKSASFLEPFNMLGLVPDAGGTWMLPRLVGNARAIGLTFLGEKISAQQAAEWGLIWSCVDDAEFQSSIDTLARRLSIAPTRGLAAMKRAIHAAWSSSFEQQLDLERDLQRELGRSSDYVEGVKAFMEKRMPRFEGR